MAQNGTLQKIQLAVQAARLYYTCNENQEQIARKLNISRPQVSRLLQLAREEGIVEVHIKNPLNAHTELEAIFCERFGLKQAVIIPISSNDDQIIKQKLARIAASVIDEIVQDNQVIGLPWGSTLNYTAKYLRAQEMKGVSVVQLKGGVCRVTGNYDTINPVLTFARKLNGTPYLLPAPSIVDSEIVKELLLQDANMKEILNLGEKAEIAVFSIGKPSEDSVLVQAGYFSEAEMKELRDRGAVGDICSRYFNIYGEIFDPRLDARTIGIELDKLRKKPYSIAIAGGVERAGGILGALRGNFVNVLVTDEGAAKEVLLQAEI